jgi:hypothetical protein
MTFLATVVARDLLHELKWQLAGPGVEIAITGTLTALSWRKHLMVRRPFGTRQRPQFSGTMSVNEARRCGPASVPAGTRPSRAA